jgi:hypothetical protein
LYLSGLASVWLAGHIALALFLSGPLRNQHLKPPFLAFASRNNLMSALFLGSPLCNQRLQALFFGFSSRHNFAQALLLNSTLSRHLLKSLVPCRSLCGWCR